jgi:hypothetical protein
MDFDWKSLVGKIAPTIGTALGGPLGGMAVSAIADAIGLSDKTEDAVRAALAGANPDQMIALKQADQAFALKMRELGFNNLQALERIAADDRSNARNREIQLRDNTPRILAYAVTIGFFGVLFFLLAVGKPTAGGDALLVMLGALGTAWAGIISYYFGTSAGSARKDVLMFGRKAEVMK